MNKRAFKMSLKEADDSGTFEAYLSTFGNLDGQGDVVDEGAFTRTLEHWKGRGDKIPLLWQHDRDQPVGYIDPEDTLEDSHGLKVRGKLLLTVAKAREVYEFMKDRIVTGMSIGFDVVKQSWDDKVRHLKELRLYEGSLVLWPANELARVGTVKSEGFDDAFAEAKLRCYEAAQLAPVGPVRTALEAVAVLGEGAAPRLDGDATADAKNDSAAIPDCLVEAVRQLRATIARLEE